MKRFNIVTYVSASYVPALLLTARSWRQRSGVSDIAIYTDQGVEIPPELGRIVPQFAVSGDNAATAWMRKIEVIHLEQPRSLHLVWLDADVYCTGLLLDAFARMGTAEIGATRMFDPKGINAGVMFFQWSPALIEFLLAWTTLAKLKQAARSKWFEQEAASELVHEAFHGRKPYYATPLSEQIYNCDQLYNTLRPRLIHFKSKRWKDPAAVARALAWMDDPMLKSTQGS
jgi:hypothetical protein